ncbi:MAG: hypothetical protein JNN27_15870 [Planctomycetes bacterium]|nr:hypothetical protein [Planctomycetota bacterium]
MGPAECRSLRDSCRCAVLTVMAFASSCSRPSAQEIDKSLSAGGAALETRQLPEAESHFLSVLDLPQATSEQSRRAVFGLIEVYSTSYADATLALLMRSPESAVLTLDECRRLCTQFEDRGSSEAAFQLSRVTLERTPAGAPRDVVLQGIHDLLVDRPRSSRLTPLRCDDPIPTPILQFTECTFD